MTNNKICAICQKHYSYCPNCQNGEEPAWKFLFDTKNCNDIWEVLNAYRTGAMNATRARSELRRLDLSARDEFNPVWKELINDIEQKAQPEQKQEEIRHERTNYNRKTR